MDDHFQKIEINQEVLTQIPARMQPQFFEQGNQMRSCLPLR
jgi:hypothetical protein